MGREGVLGTPSFLLLPLTSIHTCRLISPGVVKWSCLRSKKQDPPPVLWGMQLLTALCYLYSIVRKDQKLSNI
jgi:hypothetical protein